MFLSYTFPVIGTILCIAAYKIIRDAVDRKKNWHKTIGTVTELVEDSTGDSGSPVKPKYGYEFKNISYTGIGRVASYPPLYEIGDKIKLQVCANEPQKSEIEGGVFYIVSVLLLLTGIIFISVGVSLLIYNSK